MLRLLLGGVMTLGVVGALGTAAAQRPGEPRADTGAEPDFRDKIVAVSCKEPVKGALLQKVRVLRLGGRAFLVGETVKRDEGDSRVQLTVWFPVDDVLMLHEFKSIGEARKAYAEDER